MSTTITLNQTKMLNFRSLACSRCETDIICDYNNVNATNTIVVGTQQCNQIVQSRARGNHFSTGVKNQVLSCYMIRWFSPTLWNRADKCHMQVLTSAPTFRQVSWPPWPSLPKPLFRVLQSIGQAGGM